VGYVVITSRRIIFTGTILGERTEQIPVEQTKNLELKRSLGGRLLGYASIIFEFNDRPQRIVNYVPYPDQLYLELQGFVFPHRAADDD
jgi:PH (Pleckstrin Homology) domain-containing protein